MRKALLSGAMVLAIALPMLASAQSSFVDAQIRELLAKIADLTAQLDALRAQVNDPTKPSVTAFRHRICTVLARNLALGAEGDDVRSLQEFLRENKFLAIEPTGYFGRLTKEAVKRWQAQEGVSAIGIFGPLSRERIKRWCGSPSTGSGQGSGRVNIVGPIACTKEYKPICGAKPIVCITTPCNPIPTTYGNRCDMNADGAAFLYEGECRATVAENRPPVISSFSGPTTLKVKEKGSWYVSASDPENGPLSYSIDWGDSGTNPLAAIMRLAADAVFVQTATFEHSYANAGFYIVTITVRDDAGNTVRTASTARVEKEKTATCTADAMQCPDGSWVGRTGPNCQFVCPISTTSGASCTYNMQTYAHGQTSCQWPSDVGRSGSLTCATAYMKTCQNGQWVSAQNSCPAGYGWCPAGPVGYSCTLLNNGSCPIVR